MITTVVEFNEFLKIYDMKIEWTFKVRRGPGLVTQGVSLFTISTNRFIKELDFDADGDSRMEARLYSNLSNEILKVTIDLEEKIIKFPEIKIKEVVQSGSNAF